MMNSTMRKPIQFRIILFFGILVGCKGIHAQTRFSVKAADSLDFLLTFDNNPVNNLSLLSLTMDKIASGKHVVKVAIPSKPEIQIEQTLTFKKNTSVFYDIEKSKGIYKLVLKSESTLEIQENTAINQPSTNAAPVQSTNVNVMQDIPTEATNESNGCGAPVLQEEYEAMMAEVNAHFFETKKLETMKQFNQTHCLRVEQLRFMMSNLTLEDNKYDLLKASMDHIYDRDKLKTVEADFFLEKNKARVYQLIQDHP
ncbi:MAG: DUF4476 domain-containing protein [Flavobacteriales bacterium]|nr:DUF4476 domain-containing protein [Flavobacteriales bacterium]